MGNYFAVKSMTLYEYDSVWATIEADSATSLLATGPILQCLGKNGAFNLWHVLVLPMLYLENESTVCNYFSSYKIRMSQIKWPAVILFLACLLINKQVLVSLTLNISIHLSFNDLHSKTSAKGSVLTCRTYMLWKLCLKYKWDFPHLCMRLGICVVRAVYLWWFLLTMVK